MTRVFLFLQGPHGPFFAELAEALRARGHRCLRVGVNAGDAAWWRDRGSFHGFTAERGWAAWLREFMEREGVTDLVLYGDARPRHAAAIRQAGGRRLHLFEEGYLRPYWITYERDGTNGYSPLIDMPLSAMAVAPEDAPPPPPHWGQLGPHMIYGALYHAHLLAGRRQFPGYVSHRDRSLGAEAWRYALRTLALPARRVARAVATRHVLRGRGPYHVALLQLDHDSSFLAHSPMRSMEEFVTTVLDGFAAAPPDHRLVFKDHPLETGGLACRAMIARHARARGMEARVTYCPGGKLAPLLDKARSVVTVTSTAGQQALWRGLPVFALGRAVYARPEFTPSPSLAAFFAAPQPPDTQAYARYRTFLLCTSQVAGGFYSARARRRVLDRVVPMILADTGPYDLGSGATAPPLPGDGG